MATGATIAIFKMLDFQPGYFPIAGDFPLDNNLNAVSHVIFDFSGLSILTSPR
jgi:hypothetical protein